MISCLPSVTHTLFFQIRFSPKRWWQETRPWVSAGGQRDVTYRHNIKKNNSCPSIMQAPLSWVVLLRPPPIGLHWENQRCGGFHHGEASEKHTDGVELNYCLPAVEHTHTHTHRVETLCSAFIFNKMQGINDQYSRFYLVCAASCLQQVCCKREQLQSALKTAPAWVIFAQIPHACSISTWEAADVKERFNSNEAGAGCLACRFLNEICPSSHLSICKSLSPECQLPLMEPALS